MDSKTIKQLLGAKKLHVKIAKKDLGRAHSDLLRVQSQINHLQHQLAAIQNNSKEKQEEALRKALSGDFTKVIHTKVCNVYELIEYEISQVKQFIVKEKQAEKSAKQQVVIAQTKLTKAMQKEEKIQHVLSTIEREEMVRNEILDEEAQ